VIFFSNIIKTPSPQEVGLNKKGEEKRRKKKAPKISPNKGEVNILRGERHFNFKNSVRRDLIFSPSIIPLQKPFPKSLRKFFLTLFGPSFSLAVYMT
jgi:hypothetical protein